MWLVTDETCYPARADEPRDYTLGLLAARSSSAPCWNLSGLPVPR
jgi:hypothetical protein